MLNEIWEILIEFFEELNRKLVEMLNDDWYLWKDMVFNYRLKIVLRKNLLKINILKRYYERKKVFKFNLNFEIDQLIKVFKNFEEWFVMVKKCQEEKVRLKGLILKILKVLY